MGGRAAPAGLCTARPRRRGGVCQQRRHGREWRVATRSVQQQQQRRQQQQQPAAAACTDEVLPVAIVGMQSRLLGPASGRRGSGTRAREPGSLAMRVSSPSLRGQDAAASEEQLLAWVKNLHERLAESQAARSEPSSGWKKLKEASPPLVGDAPPGLLARLTVWFWSWGWAVVAALVASSVATLFFADEIKAWVDQQKPRQQQQTAGRQHEQQQQQQQQQQQRTGGGSSGGGSGTGDGTPRRRTARPPESDAEGDDASPNSRPPRSHSTANGSGGSASGAANGSSPSSSSVEILSSASLDAVLERASYTIIFVVTRASPIGARCKASPHTSPSRAAEASGSSGTRACSTSTRSSTRVPLADRR